MLKINKIYFLLLCEVFSFGFAKAQTNLVPNGSFETFTTCPPTANGNAPDYVTYATGWHSSLNTPDYFNSCSSPTTVGVPFNAVGTQSAYQGVAYGGFIGYEKISSNREIISANLTSPLIIGVKYFISLKVSLADKISFSYCGADRIGLLFSTKLYDQALNQAQINNWAHIYSSTIITDSVNWILIKGSIISDSLYQYINIGNFFNNANTNTTVLNPSAAFSYYYLDDVRVSTDSLFGNSVGIHELITEYQISFYPNPSMGEINLLGKNTVIENLKVIDALGQITFYLPKHFPNKLDLSFLPNGLYYISFYYKNNLFTSKIVIQK